MVNSFGVLSFALLTAADVKATELKPWIIFIRAQPLDAWVALSAQNWFSSGAMEKCLVVE